MATLRRLALFFVLLLTIVHNTPALASSSWAIAERDDASIRAFVERLLPYADGVAGDDGAAILYRHVTLDHEKSIRLCTNLVVTLGQRTLLPEHMARPRVAYGTVDAAFTFVLSGDEILRAPANAVLDDPLDARQYIAIQWPALKAGDTVGISVVTTLREEDELLEFPIDDVLPTVISGVGTNCVGKDQVLAYSVRPLGIAMKEITLKDSDLVNGRAQRIKATAKGRPAVETMQTAPPYTDDVARFLVSRDGWYYDLRFGRSQSTDRGWVELMDWSHGATRLAHLVRTWSLEGGVRSMAGDLDLASLDLTTAAARATDHIAAEFMTRPAPGTPRDMVRTWDDVSDTRAVSPRERMLLIAAMLRATGHWPRLGFYRSPALGEHRDDLEYWRMLDGTMLVLDEDARKVLADGASDRNSSTPLATVPVMVVDTEAMEIQVLSWDAALALERGISDLNIRLDRLTDITAALEAGWPENGLVWRDVELPSGN